MPTVKSAFIRADSDAFCKKKLKMLNEDHKRLIRGILRARKSDPGIDSLRRVAIRQICVEGMPVTEPERFLRAFVDALVLAADAEAIPYGVERDAMLSQIVSIFVDELHATTDEEVELVLGLRRKTPASAPRLILDKDSADTAL
jgi:hypothetical protein